MRRSTIQLLLQAVACTIMMAGGAHASTVAVTPFGSTEELISGNVYATEQTHAGAASVGDFYFFKISPAATLTTVLTMLTDGAFSSLSLQWYDEDSALTSSISVVSGGMTTLDLTGSGEFTLGLFGTVVGDADDATYSFSLAVSEVAKTPLPPALILFASALAGLGLLGRRRQTATS